MQRNLFSFTVARASDDAAQSGAVSADVQAHAAKLAAEATATVQAKRTRAAANRAAKPSTVPATAKPAKRNAKPAAAKPAIAPKPAKQAKPDARAALAESDRLLARRFYDRQSLAVHSKRPCKRADYAARVLVPVQCAENPTARDESGLALILSRADKAAAFDPTAGSGLDLGIVSRLASLSFVTYDPRADVFTLTPAGLSRARAVVKRAA